MPGTGEGDRESSLKLFVTVKANAKKSLVERIDDTHFRVWVKEPPQEGRANQAVVQVLSDYLGRPKASLGILSGHRSKNKVLLLR